MKKHIIQQVFKVCVYELSTVFVWQGDQIPRFTSSSLSFTRCVLDKPGIVPTVLLKMSRFNWLAQEENENTLDLKAEFTQKWKFCHQLLTSFQTCLTFFRNTRKDFKERWAPNNTTSHWHFSKYFHLCSTQEKNKVIRFGPTRERVNHNRAVVF